MAPGLGRCARRSSGRGRRGAFSTPQGVRRGWSLGSAAMHDGRPGTAGVALSRRHGGCAGGGGSVRCGLAGRGRRGVSSAPRGVRWGAGGGGPVRWWRAAPRARHRLAVIGVARRAAPDERLGRRARAPAQGRGAAQATGRPAEEGPAPTAATPTAAPGTPAGGGRREARPNGAPGATPAARRAWRARGRSREETLTSVTGECPPSTALVTVTSESTGEGGC